jgi:hypothetical protein
MGAAGAGGGRGRGAGGERKHLGVTVCSVLSVTCAQN